MKLDPNFVHHRKIERDLDNGKLFARRRTVTWHGVTVEPVQCTRWDP
jgi:hypothetical protein